MRKFFICILAVCMIGACGNTAVAADTKSEQEVTHIFTHALIAYPEIAFRRDNGMREHYDRDCLTVKEFKRILESLYKNDYVLVDIKDIYQVKGNRAYKKRIDLGGKKPLVLSFDDINYYEKKSGMGMNDRMFLDSEGRLCTYTENALEQINYDNDVITILENFIDKHPDFSRNNAKGMICLTGFDGILGYRTQKKNPSRRHEIEQVKPIVKALKAKNWRFACHSYGHYRMREMTDLRFSLDTDKWIDEIEPLIGKTDIYVYPYGNYEIFKNGGLSNKHKHLKEAGFKFFCGVGDLPFFGDMPFEQIASEKSLFMDRIPIDGYSLRKINLEKYFDAQEVLDVEARGI